MSQQYLLLSFNNQLPEGCPSNQNLRQVISGHVQNLGILKDFPIDEKMARFVSTDQLISIADDLVKLDNTSFGFLQRFSRSINDLAKKLKSDSEKGWDDLLVSNNDNETVDTRVENPEQVVVIPDGQQERLLNIDDFLEQWQWDLCTITVGKKDDAINNYISYFQAEINKIDEELRVMNNNFTEATNKITAIRRRNEGSLLVRNLDEIGSRMKLVENLVDYRGNKAAKENIYVKTRNISTVLLVVKRGQIKELKETYEFDDYIVPGSLQEIPEPDNEYAIFSVSCLTAKIDDLKAACTQKSWHVREFKYNQRMREELAEESKQAVQEYIDECKRYSNRLSNAFSQMAICWSAIKALRIFVESILLYGIKSQFSVFLIKATTKNISKIHKELQKSFHDETQDDPVDDPNDIEGEYHSYVSFQVNFAGLVPLTTGK